MAEIKKPDVEAAIASEDKKGSDAAVHRLNDVISEIGMGEYQWKLFYLCGLGWIADNMWLQILATVLPQVQAEFQIPDAISGMGTSCVFIGMIFGSLGWGVISDIIGRQTAFVATLTLGGIFGTAAAFSPNFTLYCILLGLMGVGVGGNLPVDGALFLEFIPKERQSLLMLLSLFWPVGAVIGAIFAWWLIPSYSCDTAAAICESASNRGWRYTLAAMGLITFAMLIFRMFFIKMRESPKWLLSVGRKEEAIETLKDLARMNGKDIQVSIDDFPDVGQRETQAESVRRFIHSLKELFARDSWLSTVLIWATWMLISVAYTMFYGFLPKFLKSVSTDAPLSLGETYRNFFIQTLCGIPGSVAGTYLIDSKIGRKGTMAGGAIGVGISLFLFTTTGNSWWQLFFNCIASFLSNLVYGVLYAYTPEVFRTGHRGTAVGMASCLGRIVGVSAPFLSGILIAQNPNYALYLSAALFALMGVVSFFLPIETRGKAAL
ncbi:major facilitator superfamily domain-containing protein [Obelidium mucronatum]|nr:major facilitator superfamily domain-containing protein [Obelidium mucronatum]